MSCKQYSDLLMRYFDKDLNDIEAVKLKQHLKACRECSEEFVSLSEIFSFVESDITLEPPEDLEAKVMDKIRHLAPSPKVQPDRGVKLFLYFYSFTSLALIAAVLLFSLVFGNTAFLNKIPGFELISAVFSAASIVYSSVQGIIDTIFEIGISLAKTYYYLIIMLLVMFFAIQWMLLSILKRNSGGAAR